MTVSTGDLAPDFNAVQDRGGHLQLSSFRGQSVLLFFFPRAGTSYCQMQARRFQALLPEFQRRGVQVIGVSSDTAHQQTVFRDSCRLDYPLITDTDYRVATLYGVLEDSVVEDEPTLRARRESFLIDTQGRVVRHYTDVDANTHASEVMRDLS